jgi:thiamine-phosphate pyrophosphorylase
MDVLAVVTEAAAAGIDLVQIRERDLHDRELFALTRAAVAVVSATRTRVVVNDRTDVAISAGAHGVHLRGDSIAAARVRRLVPTGFLIGRSVHSLHEAQDVDREGAVDYLLFGTVFTSPSKGAGHPVAGLDALSRVCAGVRTPVLAVGGVDEVRAVDAARAGARGVAAITLFTQSGLCDVVARLRRAFDT